MKTTEAMPLLCWEVSIDNTTCFTFARTKAAAQFNAVDAYREAGYCRSGTWPNAKAWRASRYDKSSLKGDAYNPRRCYSPDYMY